MSNHNLNVLILTCRQSGQRINYYNALGRLCDLTVVAERKTPAKVLDTYGVAAENYSVVSLHGIPMLGYMAFCPGIVGILKKHNKYDVIIVEQYATPTAAMAICYMHRQGIPFMISADSGFADISEKKVKYRVKKWLISKATFWITGGRKSVDYLWHYGASPSKTKVFKFSPYSKNDQPGHETTLDEKKSVRNELNMKERKVIVSVGQQIHRKGFDVLLKAMQRLEPKENEVGLYILGGSPNEECKSILQEMSISNIHFPGFMTKEQLKLYYMAADLFVFPTRYDIWGYPINEAMSFGLPIITTYQCNAGLELIEEGINGCLVEAEDVLGLYKAISGLLNDDELRTKMGRNNYVKSKDYNSESMAESVYDIISEFVAESREKNR